MFDSSTKPLVSLKVEQGVAWITMERGQAYNALSDELMDQLTHQLQRLAQQPQAKVVVIRGAGRGFCAGHDLKQLTQDQDKQRQQRTFERCATLMQTLVNLPQPVIAQVHGIATAAGCQLVASCDLAVAEDSARFATPGVNIGLFCSTPMVALTRSLAPKHAMEMLLTGEMIDAERAHQIGLINRVVEAEQLQATVAELAQSIAAKSGYCVQTGKQAFYRQLNQPLANAYEDCSQVMSCNLQHQDAIEGIDAFLAKRKPTWSS
ncbi:enoyl-CoA hydratase [Motiliproteus coralliicola]|uniref:Enoyl-CoA hydratase domain-containing protein 3, mitochondrial n=1 Tax=Motiliproteus coralliicola TaxID=2283196 RepID=A0A369WTG4_9GAMM|nr:enoyl-CoA hydratase [Motiliproteus coralliicola]RDE24881.1 enoyl-CoA hydratase [Motiliproteus coralliicola]